MNNLWILIKGNFGEVWYCKWITKIGNFDVAVKKLKFKGNIETEKQKALKEAELMKNLRHDKIVRLWCVCTIGNHILNG